MNLDLFDPAPPFRFAGILDTRRTPKGLRLSRLPAWAQAQIVDPGFTWAAGVPSGARLELVTDSASIELDVQLLRLKFGGEELGPAAFDLVVDGDLRDVRYSDTGHVAVYEERDPTAMRLVRGEGDTIRFDLPAGSKHVEVWLPHSALLEIHALRVDDGAAVRTPEPDTRRRWIHYGSSISHCTQADRPTGVWPVVAARLADVDLMSFGLGGQAQLDQVVARTIRDLPADLVSLKVGINLVNGDTMRERTFVPAVHGFLDTIRDGHPSIPILVISPIICPVAEEHAGPTLSKPNGPIYVMDRAPELMTGSLTLSRIRELLATVVAQRMSAGDENLYTMNGLDLFGPDDVSDLPDGLHPNAEGYRRMGERFYESAFERNGVFAQSARSSQSI
jgi:lysophospholipase L1-like esterase